MHWQVENLKAKLLEKLEQSLTDIQLNPEEINNASVDPSSSASAHEVSNVGVVNCCLMSLSPH